MANDNSRPKGFDLWDELARRACLVCVLAAICFLVMAGWFGGSWWLVGASIGAGAICKALEYRVKRGKPRP